MNAAPGTPAPVAPDDHVEPGAPADAAHTGTPADAAGTALPGAHSVAPGAHEAKPLARGWIHLVTAPIALVVGLALVVTAPTLTARVTCAVFALTAVQLFATSAIYHRGTWRPRLATLLRRLDHTNIFLLIAGTYTPLAAILLPPRTATILLSVVWSGALLGTLSRMFWLSAPRWVYTPVYVALGWVAVWFMPDFWHTGGPAVVWLLAAGGLAYTLGAVAYALKRPNPAPRVFGFHEIFHVGTVLGWGCHAGAVAVACLAAA
ncbi:PAQR family membrane homeostasis protein TrhA [Georgenia sp. Z1344]|uniref:PAQR family membrane homeostasis protein TrhA n=1 Tax=Georgenia sp. Z1344 TaxID=3416706 RepID=UPI003CEDA011